jgi:hypothetical protein
MCSTAEGVVSNSLLLLCHSCAALREEEDFLDSFSAAGFVASVAKLLSRPFTIEVSTVTLCSISFLLPSPPFLWGIFMWMSLGWKAAR